MNKQMSLSAFGCVATKESVEITQSTCDTYKAADVGALCFSVSETVKHNGFDSFGYLLLILQELS